MAYTLKIKQKIDIQSKFFGIVDETDWSSDTRENWGLALFYKRPTETDYILDLRNPGDEEWWNLSSLMSGDAEIEVYSVPLWTATSFSAGDVVFYDDKFWHTTAGAASGDVPGVSSDWIESDGTNQDLYLAKYTGTENMKDVVQDFDLIPSGTLSVVKTGDHTFRIESTLDCTSGEYDILNYRNGLVQSGTFTDGVANITLTEDGVYYVSTTCTEEEYIETIYDFTDTDEAILALMGELSCSHINCEDCDPEEEKKINILNTLVSVYAIIERYASIEKYKYSGTEGIDSSRFTYISDLGRLLEKLKLILIEV